MREHELETHYIAWVVVVGQDRRLMRGLIGNDSVEIGGSEFGRRSPEDVSDQSEAENGHADHHQHSR